MASSKMAIEKMEFRQGYSNVWHVDLMNTMKEDCAYCCYAAICSPCASYGLRKRALYNDMSRYVCCAGYMPCSGRCGERNCPECCLFSEVCCCFANSVSSTRFLLQDEFNIQTTKCDNCIIGFMICLNQISCIFSLIACILGSEELQELARILDCIADTVYCTVCACMQTQHKIEMDKRDGKFGPQPVMLVPPIQQMSRMDQPIPPTIGYPPAPAVGVGQPYFAPPPVTTGYPVMGYPPPPGPPVDHANAPLPALPATPPPQVQHPPSSSADPKPKN